MHKRLASLNKTLYCLGFVMEGITTLQAVLNKKFRESTWNVVDTF